MQSRFFWLHQREAVRCFLHLYHGEKSAKKEGKDCRNGSTIRGIDLDLAFIQKQDFPPLRLRDRLVIDQNATLMLTTQVRLLVVLGLDPAFAWSKILMHLGPG